MSLERTILRTGGAPYHWSSRFFPRAARADVSKLYEFLRIASDYADARPLQKVAFRAFRRQWQAAWSDPHYTTEPTANDTADERAIRNMLFISRKYAFEPAWVRAFFDAKQADMNGNLYETLDDTLRYVYGSAEVVSLMVAKIMRLNPQAYEAARLQGRAIQFMNLLRDVAEDYALGRQYIPQEDLRRFELPDLSEQSAREFPAAFKKLMQYELARYTRWQNEASEGLAQLPVRIRIPLKTAIDMYDWTGRQLVRTPLLVYSRKLRPAKTRVLRAGFKNALLP